MRGLEELTRRVQEWRGGSEEGWEEFEEKMGNRMKEFNVREMRRQD